MRTDFVVKCGKDFTKMMRVINERTVVRCAKGHVFSTDSMTFFIKEPEEKAAKFEDQTKKPTQAS